MVLWLTRMKKIIVNEFTVPWEETCGATKKLKKNSCQSVERKVRKHGTFQWRSFAEDFQHTQSSDCFPHWELVTGRIRRTTVRKLGQAAERSSCWIWSKRSNSNWKPTPGTQWLITSVDPHPESLPSKGSHDEGWPRLRTSGVTQQHHNALMFSIYPSAVMEEKVFVCKLGLWKGCYPKKKRFSCPIQAVCWPFNSRREIHADTALVWVW